MEQVSEGESAGLQKELGELAQDEKELEEEERALWAQLAEHELQTRRVEEEVGHSADEIGGAGKWGTQLEEVRS